LPPHRDDHGFEQVHQRAAAPSVERAFARGAVSTRRNEMGANATDATVA
jgi:hypothetical protein